MQSVNRPQKTSRPARDLVRNVVPQGKWLFIRFYDVLDARNCFEINFYKRGLCFCLKIHTTQPKLWENGILALVGAHGTQKICKLTVVFIFVSEVRCCVRDEMSLLTKKSTFHDSTDVDVCVFLRKDFINSTWQ